MSDKNKPRSAESATTADELVRRLASKDDAERKDARLELEGIGQQAVDPLVKAQDNSNAQIRWGAAKALGNIGEGSAAAEGLANALADDSFDVRWMAAKGLVKFERGALQPLLHVLATRPDSPDLYVVARYVVRHLIDEGFGEILRPVKEALDSVEPAIQTPAVAKAALDKLLASR
jgi:HEAT repeat protein